MSTALINTNILSWARERAKLNIEVLAKKASTDIKNIISWEHGEAKPTFKQAQKLANILHIPFGYLFLSSPPAENKLAPDLRTIDDSSLLDYSADLKDVISDCIRKQDWYRDYLKENDNERCSFTGRFNLDDSTQVIADDITKALQLAISDRQKVSDWEYFFRLLIKKAENIGIWIIRNGKVGNNTHRILNVEEFRGFALCDDYAPLVFINGADAKTAQIFTLMHEISHLWLGESGISDMGIQTDANVSNKLEKKCNDVAAEVLVPTKELTSRWVTKQTTSVNAEDNAKFFKVSPVVVARRALDLNLITRDDFFEYYREQQRKWKMSMDKQKESGGGPSFYKILPGVNGYKFTEAVLQSVLCQKTLIRDGAKLLGVKPSKIDLIAREVGIL